MGGGENRPVRDICTSAFNPSHITRPHSYSVSNYNSIINHTDATLGNTEIEGEQSGEECEDKSSVSKLGNVQK